MISISKYLNECLDNYSETDKIVINAICKAMNQKHRDI